MIFLLGVVCWEGVCIALLHDVFEDTEDITPELVELMFGTSVCFGVMCLTKRKGLSTQEYRARGPWSAWVTSSSYCSICKVV